MPKQIPSVAVLIETSTSWGRRIIRGIGNYVQANKPWSLFLEAKGMEEEQRLPSGWNGNGVIAAIRRPSLVRQLQKAQVPVVNVSALELVGSTWPRVLASEAQIVQMAFEHLRERGFVNFGYWSNARLSYVQKKATLFANHVERAGYECHVDVTTSAETPDRSYVKEHNAVTRWLRKLPKPIAIMCPNAIGARRIADICHAAGIHVPEDVAIIAGSTDDLMIEMVHPPISAVDQPVERIGYEAAHMLDQMMSGMPSPTTIELPPLGILARHSTDVLAVDEPEIRSALRFIRDHAAEPIGVPDLLNAIPISRRVLERKFKKIIGRTPLEEIRRVHLARAAELLSRTNLAIPKVAQQSGFQYVEHFIPVFRKYMGMTPLAYRKHAHP